MDVSIIVTAYNYGEYIDECLDSCLNQSRTALEYEVIVVDDGSTDDTPTLLKRRDDPRLRVLRIENSGIEMASNRGFEQARGRFVVRVDADDVLEPNYLCCIAAELRNDAAFYYGDYTIINAMSMPERLVRLPNYDHEEVLNRGDFLATGTLYPTALIQEVGGYETLTKNSGLENYELIIKIMSIGATGIHVAAPLFKYRRHAKNMSERRMKAIIAYGRKLFKRNGLGNYSVNKNHPYIEDTLE
jgi:glycosyltransferase involved in cell wall biosynthesis